MIKRLFKEMIEEGILIVGGKNKKILIDGWWLMGGMYDNLACAKIIFVRRGLLPGTAI